MFRGKTYDDHAGEALSDWKDDYNTVRPHSALGNVPPAVYANLSDPDRQRDRSLELHEGSAPRPVASPSHCGSEYPSAHGGIRNGWRMI
jgi:putative transposase